MAKNTGYYNYSNAIDGIIGKYDIKYAKVGLKAFYPGLQSELSLLSEQGRKFSEKIPFVKSGFEYMSLDEIRDIFSEYD